MYSLSHLGVDLPVEESKDQATLKEFKVRINDVITNQDDYCLSKWLKARHNDVNKAEAMFRASLAYREKMSVNTLCTDYEPPEVLKKYLTGGNVGFDKEGSPVRVELFGRLDLKGIMHSARRTDLEKTKLLQCEGHLRGFEDMSRKLNRRVDGLTMIFDMEGVASKMMWKPGLQMYLHLVKVLEDNYPEMLKRMFVINAPRIFPIFYKLCRPLITEDTKRKIHILSGGYKTYLLKYIDAEELPAFLGGIKTDPDGNPRCCSMIPQGGKVPAEYFLTDMEHAGHMVEAAVTRGGRHCVSVEVVTAGSVLRWEFKTQGYDIGFGVFHVADKETTPIVATMRVNSHMVPEDGSVTCDTPGHYSVIFDNSFSWARGKTVQYHVEVVSPLDDGGDQEIQQMTRKDGSHLNNGADKQ